MATRGLPVVLVGVSFTALLALPSTGTAQAYVGWVQHAPSTSPSARAAHAMVFDEARGRTLLFGGWSNLSSSCCALADTWEWTGTQWLPRQPATAPPPRAGAAIAYDAPRQRVVMFGGADFTTFLADTWEWDGTDWIQRQPAVSPPARMLAGAAYDALRAETVVFGGYDGQNHRDDTWVWNGTTWTQRTVATHPAARKQMAMVFDAAAGTTVLFGGEQGAGGLFGDTWLWNGAGWSQLNPGTSPGPLWAAGASFEATRGRAVLFGGFRSSGVTDEMWEWDGLTWNLRGAVQSPSPRQNPGLVFAPSGEAVLFGGLTAAGVGALADTWTFRGGYPAWFHTFGSGCVGSLGTPQLDRHPAFAQLPWLGTTFGLRITNVPAGGLPPLVFFGWSDTSLQGVGLPLPLAALGMPGCSLWNSTEVPLPSSLAGTVATLLLPIPPTMAILGTRFFGQALVFDAAANPFGATVSNAVDVQIGSR